MKLIFHIVLLCAFSTQAFALTYEEKLEDFVQLYLEIKNEYGPLKHKEDLLKFDYGHLSSQYYRQITPEMTDSEFYYHLVKFGNELKDLHFGINNGSRATMRLGFTVEHSFGKFYITKIDKSLLPDGLFPFKQGDELIEFNGLPTLEYIEQNIYPFVSLSNKLSQLSFGTMFLTMRRARNIPAPSGKVKLAIKPWGKSDVTDVEVSWKEDLTALTQPQFNQNLLNLKSASEHFCNDTSRIAIPTGANIIDVPFTAYSLNTEKGRVGFIRIPHYAPFNRETNEIDATQWLLDYEKAIQQLNETTDGLIIDQDFNCGGSVALVHKMVSYFAKQAFDPLLMEFRTGDQQLATLNYHFQKYYKEGTFQYDKFKLIIEQVTESALNGDFLTPKTPVWGFFDYAIAPLGVEKIEPNKVRYTKPILLLINEMSASGGDMFPSFMKDLGFAKLMGQPTVGAGGHVYTHPENPFYLSNSKIRAQITRSLFYSPNGDRIEDNGVTPHIYYDMTVEDHLQGYQNYLNEAIDNLFQ